MLGWRRRREQLLNEMQAHIELETQENIAAGMTPKQARKAAMRTFGNPLLSVEQSREAWGGMALERILQDVRYALRGLLHAPGYAVTLVLTLALGLGAVATMLAIVDSILLRPVALPHPEQLTLIYAEGPHDGTFLSPYALSYKAIEALQKDTHQFSAIAGYNTMVRPIETSEGTRVSVLTEVSPQFFSVLGVPAKLGRLISAQDANSPVVVVNDEFWRERLHADPKIVGSSIKISGRLCTILGVLPPDLRFPQGMHAASVFTPMTFNAKGEDEYSMDSASVLARLKSGTTLHQAQSEAQSVFAHFDPKGAAKGNLLRLHSYQDSVTGDLQKPLWALLGAVAVLLLIACANAANLQIGRAASRMPEMQVRAALGASFSRLLQQLITESVLVSLVGAALGAAAAYATVALVRHAYGSEFTRFDELSIRPEVLLAMAALAVAVGVASSLVPSWSIRRQTIARVKNRTTTQNSRVPAALVVLQVALTCILLVTSGLFVRTFRSLQEVKLGFDPHGVTTMVVMPLDQHQDPQRSRQIETELLHRLETLPGVEAVTMQTALPFSSYNFTLDGTTDVAGRPYHEGDSAHYSFVSTDFVRTSGIRLLQGRSLLPQDESSPALVVLVNQAFANKYLAGRDPLGATLKFHRKPEDTDADLPFLQSMSVVGVVENEIEGGDLGAPYQPMVYLDYLQLPRDSMLSMVFSMDAQYAIRSKLPPDAIAGEIRRAVKQAAPTMAEMSLRPMTDGIDDSLRQRRLGLRLVSGFGVIATILSAIGIYGVLAYSVTLRRREIGVRMALGSSRAQVTTRVLRQAATMLLLGIAPGLVGAWAAGRAIRSFLFGVQVLDPATLASVTLLLALVCTVAAFVPAFRAATVNPMEILRSE